MLLISSKNVLPITWIIVALSSFLFLFSVGTLYYNAKWSLERIDQIVIDQKRPIQPTKSQNINIDKTGIILGEANSPIGKSNLDKRNFIPDFYRPFMQDLSMVSPFLVAYVSLAMFAEGLFFLVSCISGAKVIARDRSPFPKRYQVYFVQIGLIGTLIAFVIAFSNLQSTAEAQFQTKVLLDSLGTALYSTLVALILAYLICPLIEKFYAELAQHIKCVSPANTIDDELEIMRKKTINVTDELDKFGKGIRKLHRVINIENLNSKVDSVDERLAALNRQVAAQEIKITDIENKALKKDEEIASLTRCYKENNFELAAAQVEIKALKQNNKDHNSEYSKVKTRLSEIEESLKYVRKFIKKIRGVIES